MANQTEAEAEELPSFYFLKERDGGQTIRVYTCHSDTVPEDNAAPLGQGLSRLGLHCPEVADVARADLGQLILDMSTEMDDLKGEHGIIMARRILGFTVAISSTFAGVFGGVGLIEHFFIKPLRPMIGTKKALVLSLASGIVGLTMTYGLFAHEDGQVTGIDDYEAREILRRQIRAGIIDGKKKSEIKRRIFNLFENFLNQYGRPVDAERDDLAIGPHPLQAL